MELTAAERSAPVGHELRETMPLTAGDPSPGADSPPMRRLIRCKATKTFLTKEGAWTSNIQEALQFGHHTEAWAARKHFGLQDVELYYSFDNAKESQYDFPLAL